MQQTPIPTVPQAAMQIHLPTPSAPYDPSRNPHISQPLLTLFLMLFKSIIELIINKIVCNNVYCNCEAVQQESHIVTYLTPLSKYYKFIIVSSTAPVHEHPYY